MLLLLWLLASAPLEPPSSGDLFHPGPRMVEYYGGLADSLNPQAPATFRFWAESRGNAEVVARVALPPGLEWVEGDTLVRIHPDRMETWVVRARAAGAGPFEIRGSARAERRDGVVDELEWKIVVAPGDHDGISNKTRVERTVGGNRYRWMSGCLVPVADAEAFSAEDIRLEGIRARPVDPVAIVTPEVREAVVSTLLVIVDASGGVIAVAPWVVTTASASAMEAVRGWRFEPTRFRGRAITDLVTIEVTVKPERH